MMLRPPSPSPNRERNILRALLLVTLFVLAMLILMLTSCIGPGR